jgi:excisionase family DNA binding protein
MLSPATPQADPDRRTLTREQVAELFRVTPRTVQRWTKAGKLRSLRASDVEQLLDPANDQAPQPTGRRRQGQRP